MEKGTPAWKRYTTPGCEGCDNYQVCSPLDLQIVTTYRQMHFADIILDKVRFVGLPANCASLIVIFLLGISFGISSFFGISLGIFSFFWIISGRQFCPCHCFPISPIKMTYCKTFFDISPILLLLSRNQSSGNNTTVAPQLVSDSKVSQVDVLSS